MKISFKQNINKNRYQVIPRTLAFLFRNDEVLLIERAKKGEFAYNQLNGIGGHIERKEDPLSAIRREVKEETGLEHLEFRLRAIAFIDITQYLGVNIFIFSATYNNGKLIPSNEGKLFWVNKKELPQLKIVEDLPLLVNLVEQSQKEEKIIFLQYKYDVDQFMIKEIQ